MRITTKQAFGAAAAVLGIGYMAFYLNERLSEQPPHTVEEEQGAFSIRRYPPLRIAERVGEGARKQGLNTGFDRLAAFIFGKARAGNDRRRIAMTAPVLSDRADGGWRTRFVMPRGFTATSLPRPAAGVSTDTLPPRRLAAVTFSGMAGDRQLAKQEARLRDWLAARGLAADGPAEYAFYNSPFVPGPLRRNEVLIPLAE